MELGLLHPSSVSLPEVKVTVPAPEVSERELLHLCSIPSSRVRSVVQAQSRIDRSRAALMRTVSPADSDSASVATTHLSTDDEQWTASHSTLMPLGQGGGSQLRRACRSGDCSRVRRMLVSGASVHSYDEAFERTALHHAAHHGHADCASLIVEFGADVEAVDLHQETPLHLAAERGHTDMIEVLCRVGGAELKRQSSNGCLPLHYAAMGNHGAAVGLILAILKERGELAGLGSATAFMNPDARRNNWGLTPAELARSKGHADVADQIDAAVAEAVAASMAISGDGGTADC